MITYLENVSQMQHPTHELCASMNASFIWKFNPCTYRQTSKQLIETGTFSSKNLKHIENTGQRSCRVVKGYMYIHILLMKLESNTIQHYSLLEINKMENVYHSVNSIITRGMVKALRISGAENIARGMVIAILISGPENIPRGIVIELKGQSRTGNT